MSRARFVGTSGRDGPTGGYYDAGMSVTAIVLLDVEASKVNEVGAAAAAVAEVYEVHSVASSEADLVALVRVSDHEGIARVVTEEIAAISGVVSTRTMIAFRTYASETLDAAFQGLGD